MPSNTRLNQNSTDGDYAVTKERSHDGETAKQQGVFISGVTGSEGSYTFTDVQAGAGTAATALRTTLASDDPAVALLGTIDADTGGMLTALQTLDNAVSGNEFQVDVVAALPAGDNNIGNVDLASAIPAGTNNIGDVDVLSIVPGTGATNLGKAEDAAHTTGDVGVMALFVRQDSQADFGADGDYVPGSIDADGALRVNVVNGASGGTSAADDADFTAGTTSGTPIMGVYQSSPTNVTDGDMGIVGLTQTRAMRVAIDSGGISGQVDDAAMTLGTKEGIPIVGAYASSRDLLDSGDGGIVALSQRRALYVTGDGVLSTANSSSANLGAAAAFTGTSEEVTDYAQIHVSVFSSHASATDGLSLQQSSDGTNWDITDTFTIAATTAKIITLQPAARYFRLVYTNGGTLTTSLRIQTIFKSIAAKGSSQRPSDATSNENDFEMVSGFLHGFNGTTWDRLRSVNTGYLGVTPHFSGTAASAGNGASGAQTQRVTIANDSTGVLATVSTLTNITNWGNVVDDAAFTPGTTRVLMAGFEADETATDSVDEGDGGAARMTLDRKQIVTLQPHTQGGLSSATGSLSNTAVAVKASAGQVYGWYFYNPNASAAYVQFYNTAQGSVTVGTTAPVYSLGIPATSGANVMLPNGIAHSTAITVAATTTRAGSTAPGTAVDYNVFYF